MRIYSHSSLGSFETCPRQFWYRYIGKPEIEKVETIEAFLGKRVHDTLETLYRLRLRGRVLSEEETLAEFESVWAKEWSDDIVIVSEELTAEDYKRAAREALTAYYRRFAPFDQARTLRLEARVMMRLDRDGRYKMQGYIDRVARRADGTYEIHDYKTSGTLPTQGQADEDRQLALYQIGLEGMWNDVGPVDLVWHYLRFDTDLVSHRTQAQLQAVREACIATMDDIESRGREEESFPTNPSSLCPWCEFRTICPATRHQYAVEVLSPEDFAADDGVQLVNRWAEVMESRKALEAAAGGLKNLEDELADRVVAFALKEGLERVTGSGYRAEIVKATGVEFPRAGSEQREAFEAVLKETGLWDEVSGPNHQRLASLLNDPEGLAPEVMRRLEKFLEPYERVQAKLKKNNDK